MFSESHTMIMTTHYDITIQGAICGNIWQPGTGKCGNLSDDGVFSSDFNGDDESEFQGET